MLLEVAKYVCRSFVVGISILLQATVVGQSEPKQPSDTGTKLQELINDKRYPFEKLLAGDPKAVANSKKIFALADDPERKQRIASILMSLGVKDKIYFDFLANAAKEALTKASEIPWAMLYDEHGELKEKELNPAFLKWCRKHNAHPMNVRYAEYYEVPSPWYYLAASGDSRNYDLLVQGLHSQNLMIVGAAAQGLAKLQRPQAIDVLIVTGRSVPGEARYAIAQSLLYFSDARAQAAAEELMTDKKMLEIDKHEAQTKGVKGLFQW
jgi:hypothetical protein